MVIFVMGVDVAVPDAVVDGLVVEEEGVAVFPVLVGVGVLVEGVVVAVVVVVLDEEGVVVAALINVTVLVPPLA